MRTLIHQTIETALDRLRAAEKALAFARARRQRSLDELERAKREDRDAAATWRNAKRAHDEASAELELAVCVREPANDGKRGAA